MTDQNAEIQEIITEAKGTFDLRARLQGRKLREDNIVLYLDQDAGDELGQDREEKNDFGVRTTVREGVLGRLADLNGTLETVEDRDVKDALEVEILTLEAKRLALLARLEATGLNVKLRAVPRVVVKDCKRQAKKAVGIRGKVSEADEEAYSDSFTAHLLSAVIVTIEDRESGGETGKLSVQDAALLDEQLPDDQFARLLEKQNDVQLKNTVGEGVTDQADFSPSI